MNSVAIFSFVAHMIRKFLQNNGCLMVAIKSVLIKYRLRILYLHQNVQVLIHNIAHKHEVLFSVEV